MVSVIKYNTIFFGDSKSGSRVTAILLNWWISPIDGASSVEGLRSTGLPHLVFPSDGFPLVPSPHFCGSSYLSVPLWPGGRRKRQKTCTMGIWGTWKTICTMGACGYMEDTLYLQTGDICDLARRVRRTRRQGRPTARQTV